LRWETAVAVWLTLFVVTMLHEFAHGLTCKHYGGEVHEIGFLLMFFMPCFYCNVSDAWLFRERSKRLCVTFAGGYFELFLWALAVFVWRLTQPGGLANYLAFVVFSACGVQTLFNFNPLLKLDGYYLLSDWLEIPNLKQRAVEHVKAHLRWLLWGAARPAPEPRRGALLGYGVLSWIYSILFLGLMLLGLGRLLSARWGIVGLGAVALLLVPSARSLLGGLTAGEVSTMIRTRHKRTAFWLIGLAAMAAAGFMEVEDRIGGDCYLRPTTRAELRAPLAGFIADVRVDEGDRLSPGQCAVRLHVPDLDSRIVQKLAEARESQSRLRLLEVGTRVEELAEQRQRVQRALGWRDLAVEDLKHAQQALVADLLRLDHASAKARAELEAARHRFQRAEGLTLKRAVSTDEYEQVQLELRVAESNHEQWQAARSALDAKGTREREAELARREKDLADERGKLALLEAGTRPEEIEAERARLARLQEEHRYLQTLQEKLLLTSPVAGIVTTPRLKETIGQYVSEGDLICLVEEPAALETEIFLDERQIERLESGQRVRVKLRAVPFATYWGRVDHVAPAAVKDNEHDPQARVKVCCRLDAVGSDLRPGMTGYARISTGQRTIGAIVADRAIRLLRAEFWW
jgi:multidrug resistance efflux pump